MLPGAPAGRDDAFLHKMAVLKRWNIAMAIFHTILFGIVLFSVFVSDNQDKTRVSIWRVSPQSSNSTEAWRFDLELQVASRIHLGACLLAFAAITALAHTFYATYRGYSDWIAAGWNPARWFEYGMSATLMVVIIGGLDGTRVYDALVLIAINTAVVMGFGFLGERRIVIGVQDKALEVAEWLMSMALFLAVWAVLGANFFQSIHDSKNDDDVDQPPSWLWAIYFSQIVFFSSFAVVRAKHAADQYPVLNFARYEKWYMVLSLCAKGTLIGLVLGGLLA
jgi:hypothetical protein